MTVDRSNETLTVNGWTVDTQWTRSGQRAGHECAMNERAMNEPQRCGEIIASRQSTTDWRRSRFQKCESSPGDGPQRIKHTVPCSVRASTISEIGLNRAVCITVYNI